VACFTIFRSLYFNLKYVMTPAGFLINPIIFENSFTLGNL
jgi:hypothetical protein